MHLCTGAARLKLKPPEKMAFVWPNSPRPPDRRITAALVQTRPLPNLPKPIAPFDARIVTAAGKEAFIERPSFLSDKDSFRFKASAAAAKGGKATTKT